MRASHIPLKAAEARACAVMVPSRARSRTVLVVTASVLLVALMCAQSAVAQSPVATDRAAAAGIANFQISWGATVQDFDEDGWPDILLNNHFRAPARLFRNNTDGTFKEIHPGLFIQRDRHDCTWSDFNQDGLVDVYCTIGALHGTKVKVNELWIQQPDTTFVDQAEAYGVADPYGRGRATVALRVNRGRFPDLFVGNSFPRPDGYPSMNRLFINRKGSSFRDAPEYGFDQEIGGWCAQAADYNNDGWDDLLICTKTGLRLYRNDGGTSFTEVTTAVGLGDKWQQGLLVDLDGDGWRDLVLVRYSGFRVRLQKSGVFGSVTHSLSLPGGQHHRVAAGDVNLDGRPDLYVVNNCGTAPNSNDADLMLINQGGGKFSQATIPQTKEGCGEDVAAIDYNLDGRTDFIVTNGLATTPGPVQLITFH